MNKPDLMADIDTDGIDLSSIQPDLMTSNHYRKWYGARGKERKEKVKQAFTKTFIAVITVGALVTIAGISYVSYQVSTRTAKTVVDLVDDFNPNTQTVPAHANNPDVTMIVVSGPRAVGMTQECRMIQGAGYKVVRNFHAGVYYQVRNKSGSSFGTEHFGKLIEYLKSREPNND